MRNGAHPIMFNLMVGFPLSTLSLTYYYLICMSANEAHRPTTYSPGPCGLAEVQDVGIAKHIPLESHVPGRNKSRCGGGKTSTRVFSLKGERGAGHPPFLYLAPI